MLIDLTPLYRYRDYRYLYIGQFISLLGNMLTFVALPYQIFTITHSVLAVGNIGLIQLAPLLVTSLWGGVLADKLDRRKLLLSAEASLMLICFCLWLNTWYQTHLITLYLLAGLASALNGFHRPTLEAIVQTLVKREDMPSISALGSFKYAVATIGGPALAGIILARYGLRWVYALDLLTYAISFIAIYNIRTVLLPKHTQAEDSVMGSLQDGVRYAVSRQELLGSYAVDFAAMIFGMPTALFPVIAEMYHSTVILGWLYAAPSIGMLIMTVFSGWTRRIRKHGLAIAISASIWGLAIVFFGLSHNIVIALVFLALAGAGDTLSGIFRGTLWNQTIPAHLRGRMAGIEMISYMSGPLLGNAEAGLIASQFGTKTSIVSGGILCILAVIVLTVLLPKFRMYTALHDPDAIPI